MVAEEIEIEENVVKTIVLDLKNRDISNFDEWLKHYDDTIEEVVGFVNVYCEKAQAQKFDEIEQWEKIIMLNAVALYMIEMGIDYPPQGDEFIKKILKIYIETIRYYYLKSKGYLKLNGRVLISDITQFKFVKV